MINRQRITDVTIIGAGVMGRGIAVACSIMGKRVVLRDIDPRILESAIEDVRHTIRRLGRLNPIWKNSGTGKNIQLETDLEASVRHSQLVIESVPENLELKQSVFKELDSICDENKILGSNTSGLSIGRIASVTKSPERVVGIHFFAPAYILKAVEIIPGRKTSTQTLKIAEKFALSIGKVPILIKKDTKNFLVNSIQFAMIKQAKRLLKKGTVDSMLEIDKAIMNSFPIRQSLFGLFEDSDLISPDSALTHQDREDLRTNYSYREQSNRVIAVRDELLTILERKAQQLRSSRPKAFTK